LPESHTMTYQAKNLGIGIGLRVPHIAHIIANKPDVDFFEIISENYMVDGGPPRENLDRILEHYPVVQHGVSLSIASADDLDFEYLKKLKALCRHTQTPWFSDHLCWTRCNSHNYHDLLPIPYTEEYADFIAAKAKIVQDYMEIPFALENLSTYVAFENSQMPEWEFYQRVIDKAGVYMMFDVNNVYVSAVNHQFDPVDYLKHIDYSRVVQCHVAGHTELPNGTLLDTHNDHVKDVVWEMYRYVYQQTGGVSTILEWDADFLTFDETMAEAAIARKFQIQDKNVQV